MKNGFRRPEFIEIPIEGPDGYLLGRIRVTPDRVMWGRKETKKWRAVSLEAFAEWIEREGEKREV
jgi:hypothetical protein